MITVLNRTVKHEAHAVVILSFSIKEIYYNCSNCGSLGRIFTFIWGASIYSCPDYSGVESNGVVYAKFICYLQDVKNRQLASFWAAGLKISHPKHFFVSRSQNAADSGRM